MRTIAHLSDLHFGSVLEARAEALVSSLTALAPDLVVISGGVTRRVRGGEILAASEFTEAVPYPLLIVPGNGNATLVNACRRLVGPLSRFTRHIGEDAPVYADNEILVLGLPGGRVPRGQLRALAAALADAGDRVTVLATHRLPDSPRPAAEILGPLTPRPPDLLLAGQRCETDGNWPAGLAGSPPSTLAVAACSALSSRQRGSENAYNVIRLTHGPGGFIEAVIETLAWNGLRYAKTRSDDFVRRPSGPGGPVATGPAWRRAPCA